jgi:hypothetical protein
VVAEERLLDDVLGVGDAAYHAVGDREQQRPQLGVHWWLGHRGLLLAGIQLVLVVSL